MKQEETNVAILREAYAAWHESKGDASIWLEILANEVAWGSLADGRPGMEFTKPRASKEEVVEYFDGLTNDWSMDFYHINEFVAQGGRVVALCEVSFTHKRTGKTATIPKVDVFMLENGKITQFMEHYDTQAIMEACE